MLFRSVRNATHARLFGIVKINHEKEEYDFYNLILFNIDKFSLDKKIYYRFNVYRKELNTSSIHKINYEDILDTIKDMYPDDEFTTSQGQVISLIKKKKSPRGLLEASRPVKFFERILNYDLIADLKELCIDYLDDGCTLTMNLLFPTSANAERLFCVLTISHDKEEYDWCNLALLGPLEPKIHYAFHLSVNKLQFNKPITIDKEESYILSGILDSIKQMYPEEMLSLSPGLSLTESLDVQIEDTTDIEDIKDILLEVEDFGFTTEIKDCKFTKHNDVDLSLINIRKDANAGKVLTTAFKYSDISECVLRLRDYLGDRYVKSEVIFSGSSTWETASSGWKSFGI